MSKKRPPDPLSVQELLGDAGTPPTVRWGGEVYTLGFNHQVSKARFEELIRGKVLDDLAADVSLMSPKGAALHEKRIMGLLDKRHYATLQEGWLDKLAAADGSGTVLFIRALFHEYHPDLTDEEVRVMCMEEPGRLQSALSVVAPGFFGHAAATDPRFPPARAAELAAELAAAVLALLAPPDTSPVPKPSTPCSPESPGVSVSETSPG